MSSSHVCTTCAWPAFLRKHYTVAQVVLQRLGRRAVQQVSCRAPQQVICFCLRWFHLTQSISLGWTTVYSALASSLKFAPQWQFPWWWPLLFKTFIFSSLLKISFCLWIYYSWPGKTLPRSPWGVSLCFLGAPNTCPKQLAGSLMCN